MVETASAAPASSPALLSASQVAQQAQVVQAPNGICYASFGETHLSQNDLERTVQAVPASLAAVLNRHAYYFVPLTISENDQVSIASGYTAELSDRAICHRNVSFASSECTFISTRLMHDRFALAFEFFINASHHFVEAVGVPESFHKLAASQARADVRGETSHDAWESRRRAFPGPQNGQQDEQAMNAYLEAAFADALAIYMLSLAVDFDYLDLREREYPLLAAPALAERLRHVAALFPPNNGYEFEIRYRRRG